MTAPPSSVRRLEAADLWKLEDPELVAALKAWLHEVGHDPVQVDCIAWSERRGMAWLRLLDRGTLPPRRRWVILAGCPPPPDWTHGEA